ncbi:unnamed protein product, partial [Didymodactylos carnosus]
ISQNGQVKEEIVNDEQGIGLIAKCACDPKFDEKKVQEPAIRIILTVSFVGVNAIEKVREIESLIERVAAQSIEPSTERPANEEEKHPKASPPLPPSLESTKAKTVQFDEIAEEQPKPKPIETLKSETFDLMISYCHAQNEICHKMYDRYKLDKFHVWIDKENMYGLVLESMAEVIERSDIVVVCMSSKYKESNACHLEAAYTWKQKCKMIPVKVEEKYDPTGWLALLLGGDKQSIDFIKLGFDKAYTELLK